MFPGFHPLHSVSSVWCAFNDMHLPCLRSHLIVLLSLICLILGLGLGLEDEYNLFLKPPLKTSMLPETHSLQSFSSQFIVFFHFSMSCCISCCFSRTFTFNCCLLFNNFWFFLHICLLNLFTPQCFLYHTSTFFWIRKLCILFTYLFFLTCLTVLSVYQKWLFILPHLTSVQSRHPVSSSSGWVCGCQGCKKNRLTPRLTG